MNLLSAAVVGFALAQSAPQGMQPRVLMADNLHCDAVMVRNGHIVVEEVCVKGSGDRNLPFHAQVTWDGQVATITDSDEKASAAWIRTHSLLPRLSTKHSNLYWDGKKVDLGKIDVFNLYQAIPWQGGVLIYGATVPRRGFFGQWPFKGPLFDPRDMEPFCAIFFDPNTLKGEDYYLNGMAFRGFFVFPIPSDPSS
jgi:hypothetical protein